MNKYGGPAKSNLFTMTLGPAIAESRKTSFIPKSDLKFFCSEITVPPVNVNVGSYRPNVIDIPQAMPLNLSTPTINATFMLDSDHKIIAFFHSWMQEIINYDLSRGYLSQINDNHIPYEIGYKRDYSCTLFINHYKTDSTGNIEEMYEYVFYDAFPTEVGSKTFSWSANDTIATVTVNFTASAFSFTASDPGSPLSNLTRGNGYLDFLNSVGYKGQTFEQTNLPRSVQDAINRLTTVRNDFRQFRDSLRNLF
jgi:hypothetical protein